MDLLEHVTEEYLEALGGPELRYSPQSSDKYPQMVGDRRDGTHVVVTVRWTGPDNAGTYRHWATIPEPMYRAMHARPPGVEFFLLQVGRLHDGRPWWSALYREADILALEDQLEEMIRFYRANPAIIRPVQTYDFVQPSLWDGRVSMAEAVDNLADVVMARDERPELLASLAAYKPGERVVLRGTVVKHNKGNTTNVLFHGMSGARGWSVVNSAIPESVS